MKRLGLVIVLFLIALVFVTLSCEKKSETTKPIIGANKSTGSYPATVETSQERSGALKYFAPERAETFFLKEKTPARFVSDGSLETIIYSGGYIIGTPIKDSVYFREDRQIIDFGEEKVYPRAVLTKNCWDTQWWDDQIQESWQYFHTLDDAVRYCIDSRGVDTLLVCKVKRNIKESCQISDSLEIAIKNHPEKIKKIMEQYALLQKNSS